ncbi:unnamed protein product [Caenorhabditis angaria]|uniref:Uncharacterized protein n=1 Tax=Caenorhabditis angaria TaxID=860376 RepID=A0A9P1IZ68_9PELO|nr:unnamed protein product [Caenorhabditis angaria]
MFRRHCRSSSSSSSSSSESDRCRRPYMPPPQPFMQPPMGTPYMAQQPQQPYIGRGVAPSAYPVAPPPPQSGPYLNQPPAIGSGIAPSSGIYINQQQPQQQFGNSLGASPGSPYFRPPIGQGVQPNPYGQQQFGQQFGQQPGPAPYISNQPQNYPQPNTLGQAGAPSTFARSPPTYGAYGSSYPRGY